MTTLSLNELTMDNLGQWPDLVKYVVVVLLMAIIFGIGFWVIIKPDLVQHQSLEEQEVTLKADFEMKQQKAANLQAYKNQLQLMYERFGNMLKQLPAQNEMPGLLEDISKTGIASGLVFELFAPMHEVVHDFYIELPINITVLGNYQQIAIFLSRVVELNRIVTLHNFDITTVAPAADKQTPGTGDLLEMKIIAKIYRYRAQ